MIPVQLKDQNHELLCSNNQGDLWYAVVTKQRENGVLEWKNPTPVKIAGGWCNSGDIFAGDINGDKLIDLVCRTNENKIKVLAGSGDYRFTQMPSWEPRHDFCNHGTSGFQLADVNGDGI